MRVRACVACVCACSCACLRGCVDAWMHACCVLRRATVSVSVSRSRWLTPTHTPTPARCRFHLRAATRAAPVLPCRFLPRLAHRPRMHAHACDVWRRHFDSPTSHQRPHAAGVPPPRRHARRPRAMPLSSPPGTPPACHAALFRLALPCRSRCLDVAASLRRFARRRPLRRLAMQRGGAAEGASRVRCEGGVCGAGGRGDSDAGSAAPMRANLAKLPIWQFGQFGKLEQQPRCGEFRGTSIF